MTLQLTIIVTIKWSVYQLAHSCSKCNGIGINFQLIPSLQTRKLFILFRSLNLPACINLIPVTMHCSYRVQMSESMYYTVMLQTTSNTMTWYGSMTKFNLSKCTTSIASSNMNDRESWSLTTDTTYTYIYRALPALPARDCPTAIGS